MSWLPYQLLEPEYEKYIQNPLWEEGIPPLRFVVKLHQASTLHYDFRLELYGRLLSFVVTDFQRGWEGGSDLVRVPDHNLKYLLSEWRIPKGEYGAGPMLVWDHGVYESHPNTQKDIYRQLTQGMLEINLNGIRLKGKFLLCGKGMDWKIRRLSGTLPRPSNCSVTTGKTLEEIGLRVNKTQACPPQSAPVAEL